MTRTLTGLLLRLALVSALVLLAAPPASAQPGGDDFDDGIVGPAWGPERVRGNGMLDEVNQRLEFTVDAATADDGAGRPWLQSYGPYDADWEVQLDVFDDTTPSQNDEVTSIGTTTYRLCVYDGGGLQLDAIAPAGGTCGRKACWKESAHGYRYRDKARSPDGILRLVLHDGREGEAKLSVAAKGAALEPPPPPLALPVRLQLVRDDGGGCWEATFVTARKNVAGRFKARSE